MALFLPVGNRSLVYWFPGRVDGGGRVMIQNTQDFNNIKTCNLFSKKHFLG